MSVYTIESELPFSSVPSKGIATAISVFPSTKVPRTTASTKLKSLDCVATASDEISFCACLIISACNFTGTSKVEFL